MRVLNSDDTARLLAAVDLRDPFGPRDHAMLVLALHTGLRVSELAGLNVGHVSRSGQPRQTLHVNAAIAKGGQERQIPLNDAAREAVRQLLDFNRRRNFSTAPDAPLFVTRKHERVSVRLIQRLVETLRNRADLDVPATPHALRRTFATRVGQATNMRVLQKLMGHRRMQTLVHYVEATPADLEAAVAAIAGTGR